MTLHGVALHRHALEAAAGRAGGRVMKRLTFEGNFCDIAQCRELPCPYNGACSQRKVWERLKSYEDTGLEPEEVTALQNDWSDLCTIIGECGGIDRVKELTEADKEGRLVVLPCKVGDKLNRVFAGGIFEHRVGSMKYFAIQGRVDIETYPFCPYVESSIGKTIFLTREEAEKALEAMKNGNMAEVSAGGIYRTARIANGGWG